MTPDPRTRLDDAHDAMSADPENVDRRLRFYERVADAELFVLLDREVDGETASPSVFETEDGTFLVAFDLEDRLAAFAERAVPHVALSGRALIATAAAQRLGLALNPGVAPSAFVFDADSVGWLAGTLATTASKIQSRFHTVSAPTGVSDALLGALATKLDGIRGLASDAYLLTAVRGDGATGTVLTFVDAVDGAADRLVAAVNETVAFSGAAGGELDVGFLDGSDTILPRIRRVGLCFDLSVRVASSGDARGVEPGGPPRLR